MSKIIFWDTACINCGEKAINHEVYAKRLNCPKGFSAGIRPYKKIKGALFVDLRDKTKWTVWNGKRGKYTLVGEGFAMKKVGYYKLRKYYV